MNCSPMYVCSAGIEDNMCISPGSEAILHYVELREVSERLQHSECQQLKDWALALRKHWKESLKVKLSR